MKFATSLLALFAGGYCIVVVLKVNFLFAVIYIHSKKIGYCYYDMILAIFCEGHFLTLLSSPLKHILLIPTFCKYCGIVVNLEVTVHACSKLITGYY